MDKGIILLLAVDIVKAYVKHNRIDHIEVPDFIRTTFSALDESHDPVPNDAPTLINCLECGRAYKILKKHLFAAHGLSPSDYRAKHTLPDHEPLVAPESSLRRRQVQVAIAERRRAGRLTEEG